VGAAVLVPVPRLRPPRRRCFGRHEWPASAARIGVKTLPGSSGPVAVVQHASSTSLEASPKLLRLEQARDVSPTRVLLPTLLASADVNFLLEGIVGTLLQPVAHYPRWSSSLVARVFANVRGSRRTAGCWGSSFVPVVPLCVRPQ
jgi:hypothetical protein